MYSRTCVCRRSLSSHPPPHARSALTYRWDEVDVQNGNLRPAPTTRRILALTYAAGVQVWDTSVLGGVGELIDLRIPPPPRRRARWRTLCTPSIQRRIFLRMPLAISRRVKGRTRRGRERERWGRRYTARSWARRSCRWCVRGTKGVGRRVGWKWGSWRCTHRTCTPYPPADASLQARRSLLLRPSPSRRREMVVGDRMIMGMVVGLRVWEDEGKGKAEEEEGTES
ncbi:hypothetical protein DFH06DRAFT_686645 [Mycena polygramma]|nr:hypothetical protein DFH06DRAFT_686645 [Mycena polygramma]